MYISLSFESLYFVFLSCVEEIGCRGNCLSSVGERQHREREMLVGGEREREKELREAEIREG